MISHKLFQLEQDIASFLLNKLENDQINLERAAEIARFIRQALPDDLTDEQIDKVLPSLDDQFVELSSIVNRRIQEKLELSKHSQITEAEKLIHHGKLQEAIDLMNNYIRLKF